MSVYIKQSNLAMGTILDYNMPNTAGIHASPSPMDCMAYGIQSVQPPLPDSCMALGSQTAYVYQISCIVWRMCNHEFINSPAAANASDNTTLKLTAEIIPVDKQNCYRASIRALTKLNIGKQKRGRAPSRYPERKLFSVLSKRKIRNNVKCMLTKSVPQSSKLYAIATNYKYFSVYKHKRSNCHAVNVEKKVDSAAAANVVECTSCHVISGRKKKLHFQLVCEHTI